MSVGHAATTAEATCGSPSAEATYWWTTTGELLRHLLHFAGYSDETTAFHLLFFRRSICPAMGPPPDRLGSAPRGSLTTDGTPIEYSLSFNGRATAPEVRFSIDPDATSAATLSPERTYQLVSGLPTLEACGSIDISSWYTELRDVFKLPAEAREVENELLLQTGHKSQIMLGFDLSRTGNSAQAKAYFLPDLMAAFYRRTRWFIVRKALHRLFASTTPTVGTSLMQQFGMLERHISRCPKHVEDDARYVAIDLVHPQYARLKVYIRNPGQTFDDIWSFFTLRDQIPYDGQVKVAIRELYALVRGQAVSEVTSNTVTQVLPSAADQRDNARQRPTSAFKKSNICYFEMRNGYDVPRSKMFIRAQKPFVTSDLTVASALENWFRRWNWLHEQSHWSYTDLLKSMFPARDLNDGGLHCWIAVSMKKGKLTVESYLAPLLYQNSDD